MATFMLSTIAMDTMLSPESRTSEGHAALKFWVGQLMARLWERRLQGDVVFNLDHTIYSY
jgi:hypothetical protein